MNTRKKFQEMILKVGGSILSKYIERHRLEDEIIYELIRAKKDEFLIKYGKLHSFSMPQITEILLREGVDELQLFVARRNTLTTKQQEILVEKGNVLLIEAYLCPNDLFKSERRFATLPEYKFVYRMIKSDKLTGVEIFKTYVDNCYRTLLTEDLIDLLIENETSFPTKYIFYRARLKKEWEEMFIQKASAEMLKSYLEEHELGTDSAQVALIRKNYDLAEEYAQKYSFRTKARQLYYEQRELNRNKA